MTIPTVAASAAASLQSTNQVGQLVAASHGGAVSAPLAPGWFESGSLSFELMKGLPAAFVTFVIGLIAAYIAWRQFQVAKEQKRVAHAKLNFDLFQQRYEVFECTWSMLSSMIQERPNQVQIEMDFNNARQRARFLFGAEVADYMGEISRRCTDQEFIMLVTKQRGDVMLPEDVERYAENNTWLFDQASSGARDHFGRYLDFSEWR